MFWVGPNFYLKNFPNTQQQGFLGKGVVRSGFMKNQNGTKYCQNQFFMSK
jgi:hypothetical protein